MRKIPLLALLLFSAFPAAGQTEDAARDRADALLEAFHDIDASLCGTWWFRMDHEGETFSGCKISVEIAGTETGPVYRLTAELKTNLKAGMVKERMVYHLDRKLSTIYGKETRAGALQSKGRTFRRTDRGWECEYPNAGKTIAFHQIHQPDVNYPNDDVIIWADPGRNKRAFLLSPGTKIDVIETIDGDPYGTRHIMYRIRTADGREGWVPKKWCKNFYKPGKSVCTLSEETPNYNELSSAFLLLTEMDLSRPVSYVFPGIAWPRRLDRGEEARMLDRSAVMDVRITVHEPAPYEHAGIEIRAVEVVVNTYQGAKAMPMVFTLTPDNQILAFAPLKNLAPFTRCLRADVAAFFGKEDAGSAISSDDVFAVYKTAVDGWADAFAEATDKSLVKGFDKFLDDACMKAGAGSWSDYCTKAAVALGAEEWARCVKRFAEYHKKKIEDLTKRITKEAGEKKAE